MDIEEFKARSERLLEVGRLIEKLPSEIRSLAFPLLAAYVSAKALSADDKPKSESAELGDDSIPLSREQFFGGFDHDKPADNVKLIAAWWYSQYGSTGISLSDLETLATDIGLTIPDRPNMTLRQAAVDGKALFKPVGSGRYEPTVHGEAYLKKTYSVKKGKQPKPVET